MHDLRAAVYRHLQRLSLAFFTRTRTGEIQSRIANDIGGVQSVVTSTATSIVSNVTTVLAAGGGDVPARLAAGAGRARPAAVLRLADPPGRRGAAPDHRRAPGAARRHLGAGRGVAVGLGHPARQDDGPLAASSPSASSASRPSWPTSRSARGWRAAGGWRRCRSRFAAMPALDLPVRRAQRSRAAAARSRSAPWSPSPRCRPGSSSRSSRCSRSASTCRARWRCSSASSSTSTLPVEIDERARRGRARPASDVQGEVAFEGVGFRYAADGDWTLRDVDLTSPPGTTLALVGETGSGQDDARLPARPALRRRGGRGDDRRHRRARPDATRRSPRSSASSRRRPICSTPRSRDNLRFARPDADRRRDRGARRGRPRSTT